MTALERLAALRAMLGQLPRSTPYSGHKLRSILISIPHCGYLL
jgi:hypothetical protein